MMATLGSIALAALLFALFGMLRFPSGCAGGCAGDCGHCGTTYTTTVDTDAIDATAINASPVETSAVETSAVVAEHRRSDRGGAR